MTLNTGQVRDSITQPNVIDTLRRVSVVVAKHIRTGESWRREALLSARVLVSRDDSGADGRYSKRDLDRYLSTLPQWEICRQFAQDNFVSPQWTYHLPTSMLSAPGILFAGRPANAKRVVPQAQDIALYLGAFVSALHLEAENLIICLIYVERLMRLTDMHLLSDTWRSLLLCGLLTATKIWQDGAPKNRAFSAVFPEFSVKSVAKLERMFASAVRVALLSRAVHVSTRLQRSLQLTECHVCSLTGAFRSAEVSTPITILVCDRCPTTRDRVNGRTFAVDSSIISRFVQL